MHYKGYLETHLYINNKNKVFKVHRLVAMAFIPNPENKPEVNHKDGNKQNNSKENLEWCTSSENQIHAYKNKLKVNTTKKAILQYDLQGAFIREWDSSQQIGLVLKKDTKPIRECCKGRRKTGYGYRWKYKDAQ